MSILGWAFVVLNVVVCVGCLWSTNVVTVTPSVIGSDGAVRPELDMGLAVRWEWV